MSIYAVASGKGGVGKTTTAIALGACLAAGGRETVVVDADLGMPDLGAVLGIDDEGPTLHDVLAGSAEVEAATRSAPGGFDVIPGGAALEDYAAGDPAALRPAVEALADRYDDVIVDTAAGLSQDVLVPLGLADQTILVSTPADAALQDAEKTRQLVDRVDGTVAGLIVTRVVDREAPSPTESSPVALLGMIPDDPAVREAEQANEPITVYAPEGPAGAAYIEVAATLLDVPAGTIELGSATAAADAESTAEDDTADQAEADLVGGPGEAADRAAGSAELVEESTEASREAVPFADDGGAEADLVRGGSEDAGDGAAGTDAGEATGADTPEEPLVDTGEDDGAEEESSRSLLSRLTGGLLG